MHTKRYELKYYLNEVNMRSLISRLSDLMALDNNSNGMDGYNVRSLYFDSFDDECLYQKQSGYLVRNKVRLRNYGDVNSEYAKLEVKRKHDQFVHKDSVKIHSNIAKKINKGNYAPLLELNSTVSNWIYSTFASKLYSPKVIVEYQRLAFVMPFSNLRITFDMNLSSNISHIDLYSNFTKVMPVIAEGKQILEVKFNRFLPDHIKKVLSTVALERAAISKYTLARRFHKVHKWEDN